MNFTLTSQQVEPTNKVNLSDGYDQLWKHCNHLYANGPSKCFRPEKSFWSDGGIDPLDFIYVFKNPGNGQDIPRHWHYIGFGLSDIRGYSIFRQAHECLREQNPTYEKMTQPLPELYPKPPNDVKMNGFGFELTIRVQCNSDDEWASDAPNWAQRILQDLARYVFQSRNIFSVGDHVAWHSPLDNDSEDGDSSRIEHILMTLDPQLGEIETSLGPVKFIQIVGVCSEELQAAREWNVRGVLEMMRDRPETGGQMLITDMRRGQTIFELDPDKCNQHREAIEQVGSDMAQISGRHKTSHVKPDWFTRVERMKSRIDHDIGVMDHDSACAIEEAQAEFGAIKLEDDYPVRTPSRMSLGSESALKIENADLYETRYFDRIYILLSYESARILPVMLKGRLKHKRSFSFQSFKGDSTVTFQPEGNPLRSMVSSEQPFAKHVIWLQIYASEKLQEQMYEAIRMDFDTQSGERPQLPKNYSWPEFNLYLTVVEEITDDQVGHRL